MLGIQTYLGVVASWKVTGMRGSHNEPPIMEYAARDRSNWLPPELAALTPGSAWSRVSFKARVPGQHMPKIACQQRRNSRIRIQYEVMDIPITRCNSPFVLLYEKDARAREREITLTASALNKLTSVLGYSPFLIASSSSFVASSRCKPDCPSNIFSNNTRSSSVT